MSSRVSAIASVLAALVVSGACIGVGTSPSPPTRLVVLTHDAFAVSPAIIDAFQSMHGVTLEVVTGGDAGEMVNKDILTRDVPLADVLFGVDNAFLSRALDAQIFDPYTPSGLTTVPGALQQGTNGIVTPIDYGDVCVNYDKEAFGADLPPPQSLEDLADSRYREMLVVENPATSSPGLAFVLATYRHFGTGGDYTWLDYWRALRANGVRVDNDWNTAYYTSFSGGSGQGDRPLVVSYATSPVAEVVFAEPPTSTAPTGVVTDGCFRQVEYAGVLAGAKAPDLARRFIDYMLSAEFQSDIPLNMYVFPANPEAMLPDVFVEHAAAVPAPVVETPSAIGATRDQIVEEWTDVVLR